MIELMDVLASMLGRLYKEVIIMCFKYVYYKALRWMRLIT